MKKKKSWKNKNWKTKKSQIQDEENLVIPDEWTLYFAIIFMFTYIFIIYKYFNDLDESDCNCTNHQKINYIKKTLLLQFVLLIIKIIFIATSMNMKSMPFYVLSILSIVVAVNNIYTIRNYVSHVLYSDCECAKKNTKIYIINIVNWLQVLFLGFIILGFIIFSFLKNEVEHQ